MERFNKLEEDIKILENKIKISRDLFNDIGSHTYLDEAIMQPIENLIARYKELEGEVEAQLEILKDYKQENEKYKKLANENLRNEIIFREKEQPEDVYVRQEIYIPVAKAKKVILDIEQTLSFARTGTNRRAKIQSEILENVRDKLHKEFFED